MKLHFESDLDYQQQAIAAVADLFRGQEICRTEFTVTRANELALEGSDAKGVGNRLTLLDEEVLSNLAEIQLRHGLRPSGALASGDFTVEMETGTGKTYVYRHCCKVSDEAAFCLIQRPYISKTLLTRRISPRGSP